MSRPVNQTLQEPEDEAEAPEAEMAGDSGESPGERRRSERDERARTQARTSAERELETADDTVYLKVYRYDPEVPQKEAPRFDEFRVPVHRGMTVLDGLIYARDHYDPSLTFRHSCRQAVCGSDAFFINGRQRLGCQTQIADLEWPIRVEPLPHQEVLKDLVVDMEHFFDQMHAVEPYFQEEDVPSGLEEQRQSRANREKIKMASRCIWCAACMSSCTIAASDEEYLGPAAINMAYRFAMDEREGEDWKERRMEILEQEHGVWRCQTQFSCTEVCPKEIPLTEHIQEIKRDAVKANLKFW